MRSPFSLPLAAFAVLSTLAIESVVAMKGNAMQEKVAANGNSTSNSNNGVSWIFPSNSATAAFNSTDTVIAQWQSTYENPNLQLFCKNLHSNNFIQRSSVNVKPTASRAVLLNIIQKVDTLLCHFVLTDQLNTTATSNSPSFTVQNSPNAPPHTYSADSPTTAPTTSVAPSDISAPTSTSTSPPDPSSSSNTTTTSSTATPAPSSTGLSTPAGVGIGIGAALFLVALAIGSLLLFLSARRRRRTAAATLQQQHSKEIQDPSDQLSSSRKGIMKSTTIRVISGLHETIGNRPVPQELDASETTLSSRGNGEGWAGAGAGGHERGYGHGGDPRLQEFYATGNQRDRRRDSGVSDDGSIDMGQRPVEVGKGPI